MKHPSVTDCAQLLASHDESQPALLAEIIPKLREVASLETEINELRERQATRRQEIAAIQARCKHPGVSWEMAGPGGYETFGPCPKCGASDECRD